MFRHRQRTRPTLRRSPIALTLRALFSASALAHVDYVLHRHPFNTWPKTSRHHAAYNVAFSGARAALGAQCPGPQPTPRARNHPRL